MNVKFVLATSSSKALLRKIIVTVAPGFELLVPFGNTEAEGQRINLLLDDVFVKAGDQHAGTFSRSTASSGKPLHPAYTLPLPQFAQRHGEYALVGQREPSSRWLLSQLAAVRLARALPDHY